MTIDELKIILQQRYSNLDLVELPVKDFVFEERVKQKCFHCKNFKGKWTCPGNLPSIDYPKLVQEYEHAAVVVCKMKINTNDFEEIRTKSTNEV